MQEENAILKQEKQQIIDKCQQLKDVYEFVMKFKSNWLAYLLS